MTVADDTVADDQVYEVLDTVDVGAMAAELDDLQHRLDALAREGTNPHEVRRVQRALDVARAELHELMDTPSAVAV